MAADGGDSFTDSGDRAFDSLLPSEHVPDPTDLSGPSAHSGSRGELLRKEVYLVLGANQVVLRRPWLTSTGSPEL